MRLIVARCSANTRYSGRLDRHDAARGVCRLIMIKADGSVPACTPTRAGTSR
jgi:RecB family endonuclease NucS